MFFHPEKLTVTFEQGVYEVTDGACLNVVNVFTKPTDPHGLHPHTPTQKTT